MWEAPSTSDAGGGEACRPPLSVRMARRRGRGNSSRPFAHSPKKRTVGRRQNGFARRSAPANFASMKAIRISQSTSGTETREANFGLVSALTESWVSIRAGRWRRRIALRYSVEWHDDAPNAAPEERATVADFRLWLDDQNVSMHIEGARGIDHLTISLYSIAEGLAHDWWSLFGARDREFSLIGYRGGYAVPDVRLKFDGAVFEISAHQRTYRNPRGAVLGRRDASDATCRRGGDHRRFRGVCP